MSGDEREGKERNHKEALTDEYKEDILLLECYGGESWRVLSSSFFVFVFRRNRIEGKREASVIFFFPLSPPSLFGERKEGITRLKKGSRGASSKRNARPPPLLSFSIAQSGKRKIVPRSQPRFAPPPQP